MAKSMIEGYEKDKESFKEEQQITAKNDRISELQGLIENLSILVIN